MSDTDKLKELVLVENVFADGKSIQVRNVFVADVLRKPEVFLSAEVPELVVPWKCRPANLVAVAISANQPLSIQPDAGEPIELRAGVPYVWHQLSYHKLLLEADVSVLHVRYDGDQVARLKILALEWASLPVEAGEGRGERGETDAPEAEVSGEGRVESGEEDAPEAA